MKIQIALMLVCGCTVVHAAEPVYLDCKIQNASGSRSFSAKLDETAATVTHTDSAGSAFNAEGVFGHNKVTWRRVVASPPVRMTWTWEVDRSTLEARELFLPEAMDRRLAHQTRQRPTIMTGECQLIEAPPDRKF